jgi:photosystem II stability/assembly factor-like uncharacterized protein
MSKQTSLFVICSMLFFFGCGSIKAQHFDTVTNWQKIGPGGGGSTFIPTFSYQNAENFLMRCDMTGSYLTNNGGQLYQQINFAGGAASYAYHPADSNVMYIGSAVLNQSKDAGKTWHTIFPKKEEILKETYSGDHADYHLKTVKSSLYDSNSGVVSNICVDASLPGALYFSMGQFFFYTHDNGNTWKKKDCINPILFIYSGSDNARGEVYIFTAATQFVFYKSTKSFFKKILPLAMSPAFSFSGGTSSKNGKTIFYALHHHTNEVIDGEFGHSQVWISDDKGSNWRQIKNPLVTNAVAGIKPSYARISCAAFDADKAYLISNRYQEKNDTGLIYWYGALTTNDAGNNWQWVWKGGGGSGQYGVKDGKGVSNLTDSWVEKAFGGEYIRLIDAGVFAKDGNTAIVTDWYRSMKTVDGGKTWKEIYSTQQKDNSFTSRGMDVTTSYGVHFDPFDSNHIAISYTDIGYHHSFNRGKSWIRSTAGVPAAWSNTCYWVVFDPAVKNKLWSAWSGMHDIPRGKMTRKTNWKQTAKGGICVSEDGGKTWKPSSTGMGFDAPATRIVIDTASKPGNRTLYASVYNKGIFKSVDDGRTWALKNKGLMENISAFELTLTNKGDLFAIISPVPAHVNGKEGAAFYSGAVYKSTDGAETWEKLFISKEPLFPNGLAYDPAHSNRMYLACWSDIALADLVGGDVAEVNGGNKKINMRGGIFLSEDGGKTWASIFDESQYVYDVTVDEYHPGRLYCNTFNQAAYRSDDYGKTWNKLIGYDFQWGHRAIVDRNDTEKIYLTTFGSSVWHGKPATINLMK